MWFGSEIGDIILIGYWEGLLYEEEYDLGYFLLKCIMLGYKWM